MATNYYIDTLDLFTQYGISVIKVDGLFGQPKMRFDKHTWPNRSGVEIDFERPYYDEHQLTIECLAQAVDKATLALNIDAFFNQIKNRGQMVFKSVIPLKHFLVYRDDEIKGIVSRTAQGYAFKFSLNLKVPNFPWVRSYNTEAFIGGNKKLYLAYPRSAGWCYWGDGKREFLPGPGTYYHEYVMAGIYTIFVDVENEPPGIFESNTVESGDFSFLFNDKRLIVEVNKAFTLKFKYAFWPGGPDRIIISLNGEVIAIEKVDTNTHEYEHHFTTVMEKTFLAIYAEKNIDELILYYDIHSLLTSLEIKNAGVTRFQPGVAAIYSGNTYLWEKIDLSDNAIPLTDIVNFFDIFLYNTIDNGNIDISGYCEYGENAAPSGRALQIKMALKTLNWTINDNSE